MKVIVPLCLLTLIGCAAVQPPASSPRLPLQSSSLSTPHSIGAKQITLIDTRTLSALRRAAVANPSASLNGNGKVVLWIGVGIGLALAIAALDSTDDFPECVACATDE